MVDAQRNSRKLTPPGRAGVTLVELLVVISIVMILTVAVLPTMKPAAESRRIREAARSVNVFLATARNRAIATGKPCGVIFERTEADGRFSTVLYQAEAPPPFAGSYTDSRIVVPEPAGVGAGVSVQFSGGGAGTDPGEGLVQPGDELQLDYHGYRWTISSRAGLYWTFDTTNRPFHPHAPRSNPPNPNTNGLPFKIFRQPIKTAAEPLELPAGVVVDLSFSGTVSVPRLFHEPRDPTPAELSSNPYAQAIKTVKVVFAPDGSLGRCFWGTDNNLDIRYGTPTEPWYFLIGLIDRPAQPESTPANGAAPPEDERPNWIVPTNLWISISPQTGLIATSENHYVDPAQGAGGLDWGDTSTWGPFINTARTYARESQSMGGR